MKPVFTLLLLSFFCAGWDGHAQPLRTGVVVLRFAPLFAGAPLALGREESSPAAPDGTRISLFRFYVSAVSLWQDAKLAWGEPQSHHLLDASQPESLSFSLAVPATTRYNTVRFTLGIDSATNATGPGGGALDATRGMYWAWHSGYINLKLEGTSPRCTTRKAQFQFHLGGFQHGALCAQEIALPVDARVTEHTIVVDVDALLSQIDLAARPTLMTPGEEAVKLSRAAAKMFRTHIP